ncbi:MAG: hypothetical protein CMJ32_11125 [Phycisphaerae bacterium]|nr:hypothetical protein [Phycisphaerae bacterium]
MDRRLYLTGLGPISAFGVGIEPLWNAMLEGRTAIDRISTFDASGFPCDAAAVLSRDLFDIRKSVPKSYRKATKVMSRDIELAVGAAAAAVDDASLVTKATDPDALPTVEPCRMGCHIGAGLIAADTDELTAAMSTSRDEQGGFDVEQWGQSGMENLTPLWLLKYLPNMLACHVTIVHDCQGPSNTITCAEASSILSIGESIRVIQRGDADCCLTGGAESKIHLMGLLRQHFAGRLAATSGHDPTELVRPFDPQAAGSILGEGGGILVLEDASHARQRGADIYATVLGFAAAQAEYTDPASLQVNPDGLVDAITLAMSEAGVGPGDIDMILPGGYGIRSIDDAEKAALASVFKEALADMPIVTTVPSVGLCGAGMGALATCVAAKALKEQVMPACINGCELDELRGAATRASSPADITHALVFNVGLGGQVAALVLGRPDDE